MLFHCKTPKTKQFQGFMLMRKIGDFLAPTDPDDTLAYLSFFAKFTINSLLHDFCKFVHCVRVQ